MSEKEILADLLKSAGLAVRQGVLNALRTETHEQRSGVYKEAEDDTIFQIDRDVEHLLVDVISKKAADLGGVWLLAEGVGDSVAGYGLPLGIEKSQASWTIIIDPIDGTREIMYDKRSAWFLAGAARTNLKGNTLQDIEVAALIELPTSKAALADSYMAIKGQGVKAVRENIYTGEVVEIQASPSKAKSTLGGFGSIARFFPPGRDLLAKIEDELIAILEEGKTPKRIPVLEDQYISTGGQLYEVLAGHDRYIADIRPVLYNYLESIGLKSSHVCHPYDCAAMLIGIEAGLIITGADGELLNAPMDLVSPVSFIIFANQDIYNEVYPVLKGLMSKHLNYQS